MNIICTHCNDPCEPVEEILAIPGTHCNNGQSGTHHTGHYVSNCCDAEVLPYDEWITSQEIKLAVQ